MTFKKLEVPTASITDVKKSPTELFRIAEELNTGVYVFNRDKVAGVMISQAQYEQLVSLMQGETNEDKKAIQSKVTSQKTEQKTFVNSESEKVYNRFLNSSFTLKHLDDFLVSLGFITKKSSYGGVNLIERELSANDCLVYKKRNQSESLTISLISESPTAFRLVDVQ